MVIDEKVDLEELAEKTEGYSPADLKSLLVTAQLGRLETQLVTFIYFFNGNTFSNHCQPYIENSLRSFRKVCVCNISTLLVLPVICLRD
jgi:hypothetical protein